MQTSVTFKNLDPSNHFKSYVKDKLDRVDRLLNSPVEANVTLSVEKLQYIAEINLTGGKLSINAKEENSDLHAAIDLVLDKLKKQIKKNKQKLNGRWNGSKESLKEKDVIPRIGQGHSADENTLKVKVQSIEYKPMDIEEALMQIDLIADHFLVFKNARTDQVNVLYRRNDGHFGLIQPN